MPAPPSDNSLKRLLISRPRFKKRSSLVYLLASLLSEQHCKLDRVVGLAKSEILEQIPCAHTLFAEQVVSHFADLSAHSHIDVTYLFLALPILQLQVAQLPLQNLNVGVLVTHLARLQGSETLLLLLEHYLREVFLHAPRHQTLARVVQAQIYGEA